MKTLERVLQETSQALFAAGIEEPRMEAEFLLSSILGQPRPRLILHRHETWPKKFDRKLQEWTIERQRRIPFAYIVGEQPFGDLNLRVTPHVLVPRPETELLVEEARRILDQAATPGVLVDVGTGSGNILLSLASHPRVSQGIGIDISHEALQVARQNARRLKMTPRVRWHQGHLLGPVLTDRSTLMMVTANLPYIRTKDIAGLAPELHREPRVALDGGVDGLDLIRPCVVESALVLRAGGAILLEIGFDQGEAVAALLAQSGFWSGIEVLPDLAGHPRIVRAFRKDH